MPEQRTVYMRYCTACGTPMSNDANFCPKCGRKVNSWKTSGRNSYPHTPSPSNSCIIAEPPRKRSVLVTLLLWLFLWPVMLIITIAKARRLDKFGKAILISLVVIVLGGVIIATLTTPAPSLTGTNSPSSPLFSETLPDDTLRNNFLNACEQIGMDYEQIQDFKQVDDWANGPRYSFTYKDMPFRLYCNTDSTVNTIKLGIESDVYKQGFEPYQVEDYIVDPDIANELQLLSEDYVTSQLNYPATADFSLLDWAFGRDHTLYTVSSTVTAENAFGAKDDLAFSLTYQVNGDTANLVYFILNGNVIVDNMSTIFIPERKEIQK